MKSTFHVWFPLLGLIAAGFWVWKPSQSRVRAAVPLEAPWTKFGPQFLDIVFKDDSDSQKPVDPEMVRQILSNAGFRNSSESHSRNFFAIADKPAASMSKHQSMDNLELYQDALVINEPNVDVFAVICFEALKREGTPYDCQKDMELTWASLSQLAASQGLKTNRMAKAISY